MGFRINDKASIEKISRHLENAREDHADSLEKLSTGQVFTQQDPQPAKRAIAENLGFRLRSLTASRKNINDAVSLLQTAEASLAEINNLITRMKEINIAAATTTVTDRERRYLFIEYQALHDEINRIAVTTEFNGIPLLNGLNEKTPEELVFRIDDPYTGDTSGTSIDADDDINVIRFAGLRNVIATTLGLGIRTAEDLLLDSDDEEGINVEDVEELLAPEEDEYFPTVYDEAINRLSTQRAIFGAMQSRLDRSLDFIDVYQENIAAAKSKIADTDYAKEITRLTQSQILMQAGTSLLSHANIAANLSLNLLSAITR